MPTGCENLATKTKICVGVDLDAEPAPAYVFARAWVVAGGGRRGIEILRAMDLYRTRILFSDFPPFGCEPQPHIHSTYPQKSFSFDDQEISIQILSALPSLSLR
ncbi:hypothetical protein A0H81_07372 [Grifola frondosa]|uniref:Uncharacterized protein n=1 Tax=Grifola frondosa TaxID=5627 RepID=A0A1C7M695_GRIFR|nr:hypothetical protein A0H81_07372 [Grifola frondosa]